MKISAAKKTWPEKAAVIATSALLAMASVAEDFPTKFSNIGSIVNSRHNLTQDTTSPNVSAAMSTVRNNYGEVCVYCHTPHNSNTFIDAPLWNRTITTATYSVYNTTKTLTQNVTVPGVNSLTCLSCHDGTVAIDSIINMPGSGQQNDASMTSHQEAFLDSWTAPAGNSGTTSNLHLAIDTNSPAAGSGCMSCHNPDLGLAADFTAFFIGTELKNDHPVGVTFPTDNDSFNEAELVDCGVLKCFDTNANNRADPPEVRLYNTGDGYEVECASCHDPHGVPSGGSGTNSSLFPSFLRVANTNQSALCLTCHDK